MKEQTSEINIFLKNNTAETQHLNLFDQSDPDSGGVFSGGGQRVTNYDLSGLAFPTNAQQIVNFNFNSTEVPIDVTAYSAAGFADLTALIAFLNTLGLGPFTGSDAATVHNEPNYSLASDNGGLPGAVLDISDAAQMTFEVDQTLAPNVTTSDSELSDIDDASLDVTLNVGTVPPTGSIPAVVFNGNKGISITANFDAAVTWSINLYVNGTFLAGANSVVPQTTAVYDLSPLPHTFVASDVLQVKIENNAVTGTATYHLDNALTSGVTGNVAANDLSDPSNDDSQTTTPGTSNYGTLDTENVANNKQIVVTGTATGNYKIDVLVNSVSVDSTTGAAGAVNWTTTAFSVAVGDLLQVSIDPN